jgi:hypothetical protein
MQLSAFYSYPELFGVLIFFISFYEARYFRVLNELLSVFSLSSVQIFMAYAFISLFFGSVAILLTRIIVFIVARICIGNYIKPEFGGSILTNHRSISSGTIYLQRRRFIYNILNKILGSLLGYLAFLIVVIKFLEHLALDLDTFDISNGILRIIWLITLFITFDFIINFYPDEFKAPEILEHGIIRGAMQIHWSDVVKYRWIKRPSALGLLYIRQKFSVLEIRTSPLYVRLYMIVPETLRLEISEIFASKISSEATNILIIPDSGWALGLKTIFYQRGMMTNQGSWIPWQDVISYHWKRLSIADPSISFYHSLLPWQRYRLLQLKWRTQNNQVRQIVLPIPGRLIPKVQTYLTQKLPAHVPPQLPPG